MYYPWGLNSLYTTSGHNIASKYSVSRFELLTFDLFGLWDWPMSWNGRSVPVLRRCRRDTGIPGARPASRWQRQSKTWKRSDIYFIIHTTLYWTPMILIRICLFFFYWQMRKLQRRLLERKRNLGRDPKNSFAIFTGDTWPSYLDKLQEWYVCWVLWYWHSHTKFIVKTNPFMNYHYNAHTLNKNHKAVECVSVLQFSIDGFLFLCLWTSLHYTN